MNLKARLKTYSFWVSLASAIFLIIKVLGQSLGFSVDENLYNDIFTALCGILVICGIIAPPTGKEDKLLPASSNSQKIEVKESEPSNQITQTESKNTEPDLETNVAPKSKDEELNDNQDFVYEQESKPADIKAEFNNANDCDKANSNNGAASLTDLQTNTEQEDFAETITNKEEQEEQIASVSDYLCSQNDNYVSQEISESNTKNFIKTEEVLTETKDDDNFQSVIMDIPR